MLAKGLLTEGEGEPPKLKVLADGEDGPKSNEELDWAGCDWPKLKEAFPDGCDWPKVNEVFPADGAGCAGCDWPKLNGVFALAGAAGGKLCDVEEAAKGFD